uniref:Uncharacterized protein n=1 Tax=Anopheles quadriannulatus TaxID=34691 RepID=A0A182XC91_ANOQN
MRCARGIRSVAASVVTVSCTRSAQSDLSSLMPDRRKERLLQRCFDHVSCKNLSIDCSEAVKMPKQKQ